MRLEVCIDSLESAHNALNGGADELELCSSLTEGGLTPSPGLVIEVIKMVNKKLDNKRYQKPRLNVMIRCRGGSNFCYTKQEMATMLSDIDFFKAMAIDKFVFGALTEDNRIDRENCKKVIDRAHPLQVTFHRAFDVCRNPEESIKEIINLGFKRLLTSGQQESVNNAAAIDFIHGLIKRHSKNIEIMPGSGVCYKNVGDMIKLGCEIVHSSCKFVKNLTCSTINMGSDKVYVTNFNDVKKLKEICNSMIRSKTLEVV